MKYNLILIAALLLTQLKNSEAQKESTVKTTIQSVTVYLQGAEITSTAKASLSQGTQEIILEGLSSYTHPQSLQVLTSNDNIIILSATFQNNYLKGKENDPKYMAVKDSVDFLTDAYMRVVNLKAAFNEEQNMILANKKVSGDNTGLNLADLQKAAEYFRTRLNQIKNEITGLEIKEKKLNERLTRHKQQLNQMESGTNYPSGEVVVKVEANSSVTASFKVSYFVSQANWKPVYDVRVKDIKDQPKLAYKAEVAQTTGVDWKNIKLTVSTGNPSMGGTQPQLHPWFINYYHYPKKQNIRSSGNYDKNSAMPSAAPSKMEDASYNYQPPPVEVSENQLAVEFQIENPYDIASDGKGQLVTLKQYTLKANYKYYAVPKLDKDAFLLAKVTEWDQLQLIPGEANIFFEGAFVGQVFLDPNQQNDTLDISLGRDKKIVIQREKIQDYEKHKFIGTNKKETLAFNYSIRNTKSTPIEIEVFDQVPISQNSEIEVKAEELSNGSYNAAKGEVKWNFAIPPSDTKKFKFVYSVKYPKDKVIRLQ